MGIVSELIRLIKSPISMILIILLLILLPTIIHTNLMLPPQSTSGGGNLKEVLKAATMPSRTVILTIVEKSWASHASIIDLFLESLEIGEETKHLLNHLIIVGLDLHSVDYCKSIHPHCFHLETTGNVPLNYHTLGRIRNQLLLQVFHFGYNVLYTDADVMWLKNPFPLIESGADITIGCDSYESSNGKVGSGGFFHMRGYDTSIEFINLWNLIKVLYPQSQNQSLCEIVSYEDFNIKVQFIDTKYYGGFCHANKDITDIYSMHANCCDDLENKVHDLVIFLEDSKYNGLVGKGPTLDMLSSSGKSPMRCFSS